MLIQSDNNCRSVGERHRMVSQPSRLWLLVIRHRCVHTNAEPKLPRAVRGYCCRSGAHSFGRKSVPRSIPHIPERLQTTKRRTIRISDDSIEQNRRFRCALQAILCDGGQLLQIGIGLQVVGLIVE